MMNVWLRFGTVLCSSQHVPILHLPRTVTTFSTQRVNIDLLYVLVVQVGRSYTSSERGNGTQSQLPALAICVYRTERQITLFSPVIYR
jgi:hypothetical protein